MKHILFFILLTFQFCALAQKKIIDHTVYNDWKSLKNQSVSANGKFISYEKNPHKGDGFIYVYSVETEKSDSFPRGKNGLFSSNSNYFVFTITPGFDTLRNCELNKIDKKKWPKDSLGIYFLEQDSIIKFPKIKSFELAEDGDWMVYLSDHNDLPIEPVKKKRCLKKKKSKEVVYKSNGNLLHIFDPLTGKEEVYKDVTQFKFSENGDNVAFVTHKKVKIDSVYLNLYNTNTGVLNTTKNGLTDLQKMNFDNSGERLIYLASMDTIKNKNYDLRLYDVNSSISKVLIDTLNSNIDNTESVSIHFEPFFTKDDSKFYFGVSERQKPEVKDSLLESEKVKLDLWHYADKRLQPQQLKEKKRDEKRADIYVYHFSDNRIVKISNDTLHVKPSEDPNGNYLFATSNERYAGTYNWVIPYPEDHFRVSLETGEIEQLRTAVEFGFGLSPKGTYYTFYDDTRKNYFVIETETSSEICLTCSLEKVNWQDDVNGMPVKGDPFGVIGFTENEKEIWLQSEFDIWAYNFEEKKAYSLSDQQGKEKNIELRAKFWSSDSIYLDYDNVFVTGLDKTTKGIHIYTLINHDDHTDLKENAYYEAALAGINRSEDKSRIIIRKMTFQDYPELYSGPSANLSELKKISNTNPQQSEYNWGTVELIKWKSYEGRELEGLLYKPEDFDSTKQYPLLVYYYELYSDKLHSHYIPKPTASIIFPSEYTSAGYVVFIPDIRYTTGHPAKSAYDCIMSGTDKVLELLPNIDSKRMGLQGQSWGGYQTAQLITMTNRYAAAMAGAPVSNMFSAYGGIRWGSGLNRQFQYEKTQSRIGYTIWEKPELYIENSPIFHLPKVETPLLIMHNDGDGAVPWYQGIELFTGMKRLNKEVWLLNYNDDDHNLMQNANRIDLSIRMRQFFDYYLNGQEAPQWLLEGIPAVVKGIELRY